MFLVIDNSGEEIVLSYWLHDWAQFRAPVASENALLQAITDLLEDVGQPLSALRGIAVLVGKGKFTATRLSVTVANTLAYAFQIPVVAVTEIDLEQIRVQLENMPAGLYASATYSAPPSIGKK